MAERLLKQNEAAIAAAFGRRLSEALQTAGLSIGQAAKKLAQPRGLVQRWASGEALPAELHNFVDVARLCGVDAQWLAVGELHQSSIDNTEIVRKQFLGTSVTPDDREKILRVLQRLPVAAMDSGICRYCYCTEFNACMGAELKPCHWVDDVATICSACLEPRE